MGKKITETEYRCVRCGKTMLRVDDTVFCEDCDISFQLERYLEMQEVLMEAGDNK
jgi:ribosomal protein L37E